MLVICVVWIILFNFSFAHLILNLIINISNIVSMLVCLECKLNHYHPSSWWKETKNEEGKKNSISMGKLESFRGNFDNDKQRLRLGIEIIFYWFIFLAQPSRSWFVLNNQLNRWSDAQHISLFTFEPIFFVFLLYGSPFPYKRSYI